MEGGDASGLRGLVHNVQFMVVQARGIEKPCNKIDGISLDVQSHDDDEEKGEGERRIAFGHQTPPPLFPRHKRRRTGSL